MKIIKALLGVSLAIFIGIIVLGLLFPSVDYAVEISVDTPAEYAFAIFTDSSRIREWQPNIREFNLISGEPNQIGSKYRMVVDDEGEQFEMQEEITGFRRDEYFANVITNDVMSVYTEITFKWQSSETEITVTTKVVGKSIWWRALFPFYKSYFVSQAHEDYSRLKQVIENHY